MHSGRGAVMGKQISAQNQMVINQTGFYPLKLQFDKCIFRVKSCHMILNENRRSRFLAVDQSYTFMIIRGYL